jgi:hypothetical protein
LGVLQVIARGERETIHYLNTYTQSRTTYELDLQKLKLSEFPDQVLELQVLH